MDLRDQNSKENNVDYAIDKLKRVEFKVPGMKCDDCEITIEDALKDLPGVRRIDADYTTKKAGVTFETDITNEYAISTAIQEAGYENEVE